MFETTIRFKDAVGNRDSVVIGYDLNKKFPLDTSQFHEVLLNTPFDSIFEVRVVQRVMYSPWGNDDSELYKRLITGAETASNAPWCSLGGSSIFLIRAIHQPVTVYWDRTAFDPAHCRENAYFTPDFFAQIADPFAAWINSPGIIYSCATKSDSMVYHLNKYMYPHDSIPFFPYISIREIEGFGPDTLVGVALEFPFGNYYSPCRLVSSEEVLIPTPDSPLSTLFPNPTYGVFEVRNDRPAQAEYVRVFDSMGRLVLEQSCSAAQEEMVHCPAEALPSGMYYVSLVWKDGFEAMHKLVKI